MTRSWLKKKIQQVNIHKAWPKFKDHCPAFWMLPEGYTHNSNALYEKDVGPVTDTPVIVLERRRYVGQDQVVRRVAVLDGDRVHECEIPAKDLFDRKRGPGLQNYGIRVSSRTAGRFVDYLDAFERQNDPPTVNLVTQIGLYREGTLWGYFLDKPHGPMPDVQFHPINDELKALHDAMKPNGSLDGWVKALKLVSSLPKVVVVMLAALYPLVRAALNLSAPNFALYLNAPTSTGKTTACRVAVSMFANPFCPQWLPAAQATYKGIEDLCLRTQGLPVFLQDGHLIPPERRPDVLYSIGNGQWKGRGNQKNQIQRVWNAAAIFTGEGPPVLEADPSGAAARVIVLEGSPFGRTDEAMAHVIEQELFPKIRDNYGHAAIKVLEFLGTGHLPERSRPWPNFSDLVVQYTSKASGRRILQRQAEIWACLHLVAEMFGEVFGLSDEGSPVKAVEAAFTECLAQEEHDRPQQVYELVMSWVQSRRACFYTRTHGGTKAPVAHAPDCGVIDETDNTVAIRRHALREFLHQQRVPSFEELAGAWKGKDLLVCDPGHRTCLVAIEGKRDRMVKLKMLDGES